MTETNAIPGWQSVVDWFGSAPNFHDAEVVSIELQRDPQLSYVRVHAWRTNNDTDEQGYYRQDRHALVTYSLRRIISNKLDWWNHQNVLSELWVDQGEDGYTLHLPGIYGLDGEIVATEISVSIAPFDSK